MSRLLPALGLSSLSLFWGTAASAQVVVLDEDFRSCVVPPTGWSELNNGVSAGWEDDLCEFAAHIDYTGANLNRLVSPTLDLSALTTVWLHGVEVQTFAFARVRNAIEVSTDGGVTWNEEWTASAVDDGTYAIQFDLSAYGGQSGVQIAITYEGDFANSWSIDQVVVDDQPFVPPPRWPNLPTSFADANGYFETFDSLAGVVPSNMGVNQLDAVLRSFDPLSWCNIGQLGPCLEPASGQFCLEMGLDPSSMLYHQVSNALILGLDGSMTTNFILEFEAKQYGEELSEDDGVFISENGVDWIPLLMGWETLIGSGNVGVWTTLTADLSSTQVDVSNNFYLAFAQSDDFPYGNLDGVGIDDIRIGASDPLVFDVQNLVSGQTAVLTVTGADPTSRIIIGYSLDGGGPTTTPYGIADLTAPIEQIGRFSPDANGDLTVNQFIPNNITGVPVWLQALEITSLDVGIWSNSLALTVQ